MRSAAAAKQLCSGQPANPARVAASKYTNEDNAIRQDLVDRVRAEIENGTYESPVKIAGSVDGLLDALS